MNARKTTKQKKLYQGVVISDKMDKTILVAHERTYEHPLLNKVIRTTKKYKVHDPEKQAKMGDFVEFYEGRPLSKTKYMYLGRVVSKTSKD